MTIKIKVHFYDEEPRVVIDPPDADVEIVFVDEWERSHLLIDYKGVKVYYTDKDALAGSENAIPSEYWVSTFPHQDRDAEDAFDLRDLPLIPVAERHHYRTLYPDSRDKQRLAYSIDSGRITEDGLVPSSSLAKEQP